MVEPQIVVLDVAGSSPVGHPSASLFERGVSVQPYLVQFRQDMPSAAIFADLRLSVLPSAGPQRSENARYSRTSIGHLFSETIWLNCGWLANRGHRGDVVGLQATK